MNTVTFILPFSLELDCVLMGACFKKCVSFLQLKTKVIMEPLWLSILNYFFYIFHTILIVFNLFGWLFSKTQKLHFYSLVATLLSWFLLGFWYGFGYCFLTDWHYQVLRKLGEVGMPSSYIAFLVETLTGWLPNVTLVDTLTLVCTAIALICSVWVNFLSGKEGLKRKES